MWARQPAWQPAASIAGGELASTPVNVLVAQLVEHLLPLVGDDGGSNPSRGTMR